MPHGTSLEKIVAVVQSAYDPTQQPGREWKGKMLPPYTVQNTVLEDETGTIKCGFFDAKVNLKNFIGNEITILSTKDKGLTAIEYKNKDGEIEHQIKASKNTIINEASGGQGVAMSTPATPPNDQPAQSGNGVAPFVGPVQGANKKVHFVEDANEKRESIERQVALKKAISYAQFDDALAKDVDALLAVAEKFYQFLRGKLSEPARVPTDTEEVL